MWLMAVTVCCLCKHATIAMVSTSGLDNAGKTTILKKFNGEDIFDISPTLGFNIETLEYNGWGPGAALSLLHTQRPTLLPPPPPRDGGGGGPGG